jgi:hypothetical protein
MKKEKIEELDREFQDNVAALNEEIKDMRTDEELFIELPDELNTSIGEFELKPWTFATVKPILPLLQQIIANCNQRGLRSQLLVRRPAQELLYKFVTVKTMEDLGDNPDTETFTSKFSQYFVGLGFEPDSMEKEFHTKIVEESDAEATEVQQIMFANIDLVTEILKLSFGLTDEDLGNMEAEEPLHMFSALMMKNVGVLGNSFGLFALT